MASKIKLFKLNEMECGTIRLQSQLSYGRDTADFILEENKLKVWNGRDFVETNTEYQIITNGIEMLTQTL